MDNFVFSTTVKTIGQSLEQIKNGILNLNAPYQRSDLNWNLSQKQYIILTVFQKINIPQISVFQLNGQSHWDVVDGKQRLSTMNSFVNNEFILTNEISRKVVELNESAFKDSSNTNVSRIYKKYKNNILFFLKFIDLPDSLKSYFYSTVLNYVVCNSDDDVIAWDWFRRLNNGSVLKAKDKLCAIKTPLTIRISRFTYSDEICNFFDNLENGTIIKNDKQREIHKSFVESLLVFASGRELNCQINHHINWLENNQESTPNMEIYFKYLEILFKYCKENNITINSITGSKTFTATNVKLLFLLIFSYINDNSDEILSILGSDKFKIFMINIINYVNCTSKIYSGKMFDVSRSHVEFASFRVGHRSNTVTKSVSKRLINEITKLN